MIALLLTPMLAAAGVSLIYLLCGGGLGGAVVIFIIAKMFGKKSGQIRAERPMLSPPT